MSVNLNLEDDPNELATASELVLLVRRVDEGILVEIVDKNNEETVFQQETIWPETFGLRFNLDSDSHFECIKKSFEATPAGVSIDISCDPDGLLVEIVESDIVVTYYRIVYPDWGLEVGEEKRVFF